MVPARWCTGSQPTRGGLGGVTPPRTAWRKDAWRVKAEGIPFRLVKQRVRLWKASAVGKNYARIRVNRGLLAPSN